MLVSLDLILILIFLSWKVIHSFWVSFMLLHLHLIFNSKFHLFFKLIQFSIFLFFSERESFSTPRRRIGFNCCDGKVWRRSVPRVWPYYSGQIFAESQFQIVAPSLPSVLCMSVGTWQTTVLFHPRSQYLLQKWLC